jgi:hypothetical protein
MFVKPNGLLFLLLLIFLAGGCDKEEDKIQKPPEGCIKLSDLETKHDYYLPFALENDNDSIELAVMNNDTVDFSYGEFIVFKENGFFELIIEYKNNQNEADTFLFTTKTEERENSEWGIRAWVPAAFKTVSLGSEDVQIFYPHRYVDSIKVPFIFYIKESGTIKDIYCKAFSPASESTFNIKRGVGSVNVSAVHISDMMSFMIGNRQMNIAIARFQEAEFKLADTIDSDIEIPANNLVRLHNNLNISAKGTLTVNEGALIIIDEAVDINVSGPIIFSGTEENPILVTCSRENKFWGGFITREAGGTIEAHYTIFCGSGYHDSNGYNWGHSGRQALFYTENSTLILDHCFMLDHVGQIFYPQYATLIFDDILVQRAQTGGQINYSDLTIRNSIFTDFPEESNIFLDLDNDALYISASDAIIENSTFMFAKDDGVDAGNTEGDNITFTNCRFEACFHEGAALSSGNNAVRNHTFINCIFTNCGQGLEIGFSSPNHTVIADNCMFLNNGIGVRYGDNYTWSDVEGKMFIKNSQSLQNDKDVWNMVRKIWKPKLENLEFENTVVSKFCPQYPELPVSSK